MPYRKTFKTYPHGGPWHTNFIQTGQGASFPGYHKIKSTTTYSAVLRLKIRREISFI